MDGSPPVSALVTTLERSGVSDPGESLQGIAKFKRIIVHKLSNCILLSKILLFVLGYLYRRFKSKVRLKKILLYRWFKSKVCLKKILGVDWPTVVPMEELISLGFDEYSATKLEALQNNILHFCVQGKFKNEVLPFWGDECIDICASELDMRNMDMVRVPYHKKLQPFWEVFAEAVPTWYSNSNTTNFSIYHDYHLPKVIIDIILPAIKNLNSEELRFERTGSGSDGLNMISEILGENSSLKFLYFNGDRIDEINSAKTFSTPICSHPSLETIDLFECDIGSNETVLSVILQGYKDLNLRALNLSGNLIGSACVHHIEDYVASNATVGTLSLGSNLITDRDVAQLVSALKKNTNMKELDLEKNNFSERGKLQVMASLFDSTDLNSIADSNHTCCILWSNDYRELNNMNRLNRKRCGSEKKIKRKIRVALNKADDHGGYALALIQYKENEGVNKDEDRNRHKTLSLNRIYKARTLIAAQCFLRTYYLVMLIL